MKAYLLTTDGRKTSIMPKGGRYFALEELNAYVGGYHQLLILDSRPDMVMVINADGKNLGLPLNEQATAIWQEGSEPGSDRMLDPIVGDAVLCPSMMLDWDF